MGKILIIDDDLVLLKLYSTRLAADNHEVKTATNGEEGLEVINSFLPDLVIIDLLMPKMNGFELIKAINQKPQLKNIPKIVFSSVASSEQIERLKEMGVTDYLNKIDTTPTQLVELINNRLSAK